MSNGFVSPKWMPVTGARHTTAASRSPRPGIRRPPVQTPIVETAPAPAKAEPAPRRSPRRRAGSQK